MKDTMEYNGYFGSVHYNDDDKVFYGKLEFIRALVSYEGTDVVSLRTAFEEAVDDYLEFCEELRILAPEFYRNSKEFYMLYGVWKSIWQLSIVRVVSRERFRITNFSGW